jgi:hypothetical protein
MEVLVPTLAQMGWAGMLAIAVAYVFREFANAQKLRIDALELLILRLEKRANDCEVDRARLHETLIEIEEQMRKLQH